MAFEGPLLKCHDVIKAWMALNFVKFSDIKIDMIFGETSEVPPVDLGLLSQYINPIVPNLGVKVNADLKLNTQITAVVKQSFFQLRKLAKMNLVLSMQHFETVPHIWLVVVVTRVSFWQFI